MASPKSLPGAADIAADLYLPSLVTAPVFARHVGISLQSSRRLFRQGAFPARKVAGRWVATKAAILMWLSEPEDHRAGPRRVLP